LWQKSRKCSQNYQKKTSYTTIWRDYEDDAKVVLRDVLKKRIPDLTDQNFDLGEEGREKNRLADLAIIRKDGRIAIAVKAARAGENPENDLGTFRQYPTRRKIFMASFDLWVRYDDSNPTHIKVDRIFFDRSYKFVGKCTLVDGVKYRKKDGNMRPKSWQKFDSNTTHWNSQEEFDAAVQRAGNFRAYSLVEEHLENMTEEDQRLLYERLKKKYGD
jgi:hypothetical protein